MTEIITNNLMIVSSTYVMVLILFTIIFAYHYDYYSLKRKGLIKEMKISKLVVIIYSLLFVVLIISRRVIEMKTR